MLIGFFVTYQECSALNPTYNQRREIKELSNQISSKEKTHASIFANHQREWLVKPAVVTLSIKQSLTVSVQLSVISLTTTKNKVSLLLRTNKESCNRKYRIEIKIFFV